MLNWFTKRRNERNKQEAVRIGIDAVDRVNAGIEQWRAERITMRREMSSNDFDERLVTLTAVEGLCYEEVINIDALAFLKNWYDQHDEIMAETTFYITDEDLDIVELLGANDRLMELLSTSWLEESEMLETHVDQSIAEALKLKS